MVSSRGSYEACLSLCPDPNVLHGEDHFVCSGHLPSFPIPISSEMSAPSSASLLDLTKFLETKEEQITKEWMAAILADPAIQSSESLTVPQLKNHLPELLRELVHG